MKKYSDFCICLNLIMNIFSFIVPNFRSSGRAGKWWKAYFYLTLAFAVAVLVLPLFDEHDPYMAWWDWMHVPLYVVQFIGLFGFVYWRRIGIPPVWRVVFIASVAYEVWSSLSMGTDPEVMGVGYAGFLYVTIAVTWVVQGPLLFALFLYGFQCKELWRRGTSSGNSA